MFSNKGTLGAPMVIVTGWENITGTDKFSCCSAFVVIKLYFPQVKHPTCFPTVTWISASPHKQQDEATQKFYMSDCGWFWVEVSVKQHKQKCTSTSFFSRNTALRKIESLKLNVDWNPLWAVSKYFASQCLILSTLRAAWAERDYLKDTQLCHPFFLLT